MADIAKLCKAVRLSIRELNINYDAGIERALSLLREAEAIRDIHVGNNFLNSFETVEWYAGQIISVLEGKHWFAVNSLINCCDKFAPTGLAGEVIDIDTQQVELEK